MRNSCSHTSLLLSLVLSVGMVGNGALECWLYKALCWEHAWCHSWICLSIWVCEIANTKQWDEGFRFWYISLLQSQQTSHMPRSLQALLNFGITTLDMDRDANATGFQVSNLWSNTAPQPYARLQKSSLELRGHKVLVWLVAIVLPSHN